MPEPTFLAVFLTGLFAGLHCAGMCGGIVSALGLSKSASPQPQTRDEPVQWRRSPSLVTANQSPQLTASPCGKGALLPQRLQQQLGYNMGRLLSYTTLGALAGWLGSVAWLLQHWLPVQKTAFILIYLLLVMMGLYLIGFRRFNNALERMGQFGWKLLQPVAGQALKRGADNPVLCGAVWGLVPCGLVYSVLLASMFTGGAIRGAALMFVFGLGTLPNLLALGLAGSWFKTLLRLPWVKVAAGAAIITFGVSGMLRSVHEGHQHAAVDKGSISAQRVPA